MATDEIAAMGQVQAAIEPLDVETRKRVLDWANAKYYPQGAAPSQSRQAPPGGTAGPKPGVSGAPSGLSPRAARWVSSNSITEQQLDNVFHVADGQAEVIAGSMPGGSCREQVLQAYLLCGVAALLVSDSPQFTDQAGRDLCQKMGSYDQANHSQYLAKFGNKLTGNKASGWTVTAPGLTAAAELVRQFTPSA